MHPVRFIKRPNLILTKTSADEVYWRLQDFCGLLSCFVLHSCASRSTRAVPALALHGSVGRQSSYYVLRKGSCRALELRAFCVGASQCENRMERCSPTFFKYARTNSNPSGKNTNMSLMFYPNVVSLMVRFSQYFGASAVPNSNLEQAINPLLKSIVKEPYKTYKYLL